MWAVWHQGAERLGERKKRAFCLWLQLGNLCSALMGLYLEHRIQFWPPQNKRDMDTLQSPTEGREDAGGPGAALL